MIWPNKQNREKFEIDGFIEHYSRLPEGKRFRVVSSGERPDYVVSCVGNGEEYGVELTSTYISDRSVPDQHIPNIEGFCEIVEFPFNRIDHELYKTRLLETISGKIVKAMNGYDCSRPLILSIYINEYTALYLNQKSLEEWSKDHEYVFKSMKPFSEIVLWNLPNGGAFRIRPS